jgi:Flp pilus assembly protein TadB
MAKKRRKLSDSSLLVTLEHSRMNREKSLLVLDKALLLYFSFIFVGVIGFISGYLTVVLLNTLIILSFGVLVVGVLPYLVTMTREEKRLKELINQEGRGGTYAKSR